VRVDLEHLEFSLAKADKGVLCMKSFELETHIGDLEQVALLEVGGSFHSLINEA
jgi:hypothetical protein